MMNPTDTGQVMSWWWVAASTVIFAFFLIRLGIVTNPDLFVLNQGHTP